MKALGLLPTILIKSRHQTLTWDGAGWVGVGEGGRARRRAGQGSAQQRRHTKIHYPEPVLWNFPAALVIQFTQGQVGRHIGRVGKARAL